ncbi:efflux RND transporter periplasmic adaptor subunit [soil metagenome]
MRPRFTAPAAILGVVVLLFAIGGIFLARARAGTNHVALASEKKGVTAVPASATTYRPRRRFVGTVEPWLSARVGPQMVSAYLGTVLVRPGDVVHRGDVLATLDCQEAAVASAAVAAQARSLEERQKAVASQAARLQTLADGGFVAQNDLDQQNAQQASNAAQLDALRAQLAGKGLAVSDCILRAPFDGEIGARTLDPGAFVRPGATVVTVVDRRMLRVTGEAPEVDVDAIAPKTPVDIHLLAQNKNVVGVISRRAPSADPGTRTVHFEVDLSGEGLTTPVGTTAAVTVDVGTPVAAIEIPLIAAKVRGDKANVYVIENDVAHARSVLVLGERDGSLFVEAKSIAPGALVVTEGRGMLTDGDAVIAKVAAK